MTLAMSLARLLFVKQNYDEEFDPVWGIAWNSKKQDDVNGPYTRSWLEHLNECSCIVWYLGLSEGDREKTPALPLRTHGSDIISWLFYENGSPSIGPLSKDDLRRQLYDTMVEFDAFERQVCTSINSRQNEDELPTRQERRPIGVGEDERFNQNPYWNYVRSSDYFD